MSQHFRYKTIEAFCFVAAFVCLSSLTYGQDLDPTRLSLDRIFNSRDFRVEFPTTYRWTQSGEAYTRLVPSKTIKDGMDLVSFDVATDRATVLIPAEKLVPAGATAPLRIENFDWSADASKVLIYTNSQKVWRLNTRGDYWVLDMANAKLTKLGGDAKPSTLMFAKFSPDGKRVGYVMDSNIYVQDLADGRIVALTKNGSRTLINGTSDWVNEEEFFLRDCWRWSPDSRSIAYWQFDAAGIKDFILINDTADLYPVLTHIPYPKAGTANSAVRIGVVNATGGDTKWIKTPGDPQNNYIVMMDWAGNSQEIALQFMNRLQNTDQLMIADMRTGEVKTILTDHDGAFLDLLNPDLRWIDNGKGILWLSERDGWKHVFSMARDGSKTKLITPGKFDVIGIESVDEAGGWLYYTASPENATQQYLYRTRLDGSGNAERVTSAADAGWNDYSISPNSHWAVHTHSAFAQAPTFELIDLSNKIAPRKLVDNAALQAKLDKIEKGPKEFFKVDIGGGTTLDGWMIKPPGFDPDKKYPVLFFVYGEPASQTVTDRWGGRNYLWFLMLAQHGYIVASVDNRGTPAPRGRDWRKSVYKKIGVQTSQDQADAVRAIEAKMPFIDPARVGIWGWSGGGSSTLNAMFRFPGLYKMGMAVAPVPNMRLYDTIYQERYMGLPQDNGAEYDQGSPITFAKGLKGDLLIVHGSGDDNVHYQGTEMLVNELVKQNKQFSMMVYPNRTHSISEGENTTRHLFTLLTDYLFKHLPVN